MPGRLPTTGEKRKTISATQKRRRARRKRWNAGRAAWNTCPRKSERYAAARQICNGAVEDRSAVIVRCSSDLDVLAAIQAAQNNSVPLSVRGGGYDWSGRALNADGLVIDLSAMRSVTVDVETRRRA